MAAAIAFEFLSPVWLAVAGSSAFAFGWLVPGVVHARWWWPWLAMAVGAAVASLAALAGLVPWFGRLHLAVYALFLMGGFLLAFALARRPTRLIGVSRQTLIDAFLIAMVLGVVGARIRYVYERWDVFLRAAHGDVHQALVAAADLDAGGAVWYGGLFLATAGVWLYLRHRRIPTLAFADAILPGLVAGLAVGRIGCFFNGCCYGSPTTLPWGVACAHYPRQAVHPTQLYETFACALLAAGLLWFWSRRRRDGQVTFFAVVGYGAWRFVNEALRGDHDAFAFGGTITTSQATSLELILVACVSAATIGWYRRRHPQAAQRARLVPGSRHALAMPDPVDGQAPAQDRSPTGSQPA